MTNLIQKGTATCRPLKPSDFIELLIMRNEMNLTHHNNQTKMTAPRNIEVGFSGSFFRTGDNTPIIKSVFLCLSFFNQRIFASVQIIMTALFGQPLWLVVPVHDTANPLNAVTRFLAVLRDGFTSLRTGITV